MLIIGTLCITSFVHHRAYYRYNCASRRLYIMVLIIGTIVHHVVCTSSCLLSVQLCITSFVHHGAYYRYIGHHVVCTSWCLLSIQLCITSFVHHGAYRYIGHHVVCTPWCLLSVHCASRRLYIMVLIIDAIVHHVVCTSWCLLSVHCASRRLYTMVLIITHCFPSLLPPRWPSGKASRAADLGSSPVFPMGLCPAPVIPVN